MSTPLVSVVIPFFDSAPYLGEAIESVLAQTHPAVEIILVDDGSTDASPKIAAGYAHRATLIRQANAGVGPARNAGVAATSGPLIAFLDADDLWEPDKLALQVSALAANPEVHGVMTMVQEFVSPEIDPALAPLSPAVDPRPGAIPSALIVRRHVVETIGPFSASHSGEWADWYARFVDHGFRSLTLDDVLVRRRLHLTNLGLRHRNERQVYLHALKASLDRRRGGDT